MRWYGARTGNPIAAALALAAAGWGIATASGCASLPPCPARGGPVWRQFSSDNFEVKTDLDPPAAQQLVVTLEETRAAMIGAVWGGATGPTRPTSVIAFASSDEMEEFGGFGLAGMHLKAPPFPATMILSASTFALRERFVSDDLWLLYMEGLAKTGRCADAALWDAAVVAYLPDKRARRVTREWARIRQACVPTAPAPLAP